MESQKRVRVDSSSDATEIWLTHDNIQRRATRGAMERDFGRRRLLHWMLLAKELGLPKDLRILVASRVERDYKRHPVYEFLHSKDVDARMTHTVLVQAHNVNTFWFDPPRDFVYNGRFVTMCPDEEARVYTTGVRVSCFRWSLLDNDLKHRVGIKLFIL